MSRYPSYLSQEEEYVRHRRNLGGGRERHRTNNNRGCEDGDHDDEPTKVVRDIFNEGFMHWNNERRGSEKRLDFYFETTNTWNPLAGMRPQIQPYSSEFVKRLLFNKHIAFIGDSLTRAIYKDLVRLLQNDLLLTPAQLKSKSEISHLGDRQIDSLPLDADKIFRQAREYCTNYHLLQYLFTTRAMKDDVEKFILTFQKHGEFPDVLVINSALWDLTRYYDHDTDMSRVAPYEDNPRSQLEDETNSMDEYIERISILMRRLRVILPAHTQVIWLLMPWPLSVGNSALLNKNTGQRKLHRSIYLDGNYRAAQVVSNAGYDVLDISFYMRDHSLYPLRVNDGVHWGTVGTRLMTQLLVGHLAKNITLPMDIEQNLKQCHNMCTQHDTAKGDNFPKENFEYYALTNRNGRAGKDSASGSATKFDGEGAYFNFLQRQLAAKTYENMSPQVKDVISQDIQLYRMSEIIRKRKLRLEPEEELALIERTKGAPKVKDLMVGGTYEEQVIKVVHRPNQR